MRELKALETVYNGVKYRSRIEARWAVFFDKAGIEAHYEPEGFDLGDGVKYLPDFYLPTWDTYFEVKGPEPTEAEREKAERLSAMSGKTVMLVHGGIGDGKYNGALFRDGAAVAGPNDEAVRYSFLDCRRCERAVLYDYHSGDGREGWGWSEGKPKCDRRDCGDRTPGLYHRVRDAFAAAEAERFGVHDGRAE